MRLKSLYLRCIIFCLGVVIDLKVDLGKSKLLLVGNVENVDELVLMFFFFLMSKAIVYYKQKMSKQC